MASGIEPDFTLYRHIVSQLKKQPDEQKRFMHGLDFNDRRTLRRDLERSPSKRKYAINEDYLIRIIEHFYGGFKSSLYTSILQRITIDTKTQNKIDNMLGRYKVYRLALGGTGEVSSEISIEHVDGIYRFTDKFTQADVDFDYPGYLFLVRRRLHLLEILPNGIRTMITNFVEEPAKTLIYGILLNVTYQRTLEGTGKEDIFAARQVFIHEQHPLFNKPQNKRDIEKLIENETDKNGLITA